jgi:hypothetical protein
LAELAGQRNEQDAGWFATRAVDELFEAFRLPPSKNTGAVFSNLEKAGYVRPRATAPRWTLTPEGHAHVLEVLAGVDAEQIDRALAVHPGAQIGSGRLTVLPPALAPAKWSPGITSLLKRTSFDRNVLCMTRFPDDPPGAGDPIGSAITEVRRALSLHDLTLHLADDRVLDDDLLSNVAAYMWACRYGIALVEDRVGRGVNGNVLIELGAMVMAGRRCLLLKDNTVARMPTDFVARIYKSVDLGSEADISHKTHVWLRDDLELGTCAACPKV